MEKFLKIKEREIYAYLYTKENIEFMVNIKIGYLQRICIVYQYIHAIILNGKYVKP